MFAKSILLASFAVMALADPIPAPVPQATSDILGSLPTDDLSSLLDAASSLIGTDYSSLLGDATAALGALSDIPTLPASVQSVLATAIPASELTRTDVQCLATSTPAWYKDLPKDAKSALSSYETAFASWYSEHSSELALSTGIPAPCQAATTGGAAATGDSTTTSSGARSTSTAAGTAAGAGTSTAAAPRATAMAASIAGLAGMLGVMVAL